MKRIPHSKGDLPTRREFNRMVDAANRSISARPGSSIGGLHSNSMSREITPFPFKQFIAEIHEPNKDDKGASISGQFKIYLRYFDPSESDPTEQWKTDETCEYYLDCNGTDISPSSGDHIVVWWNEPRQMFVPGGGGGGSATSNWTMALLIEDLLAGDSAPAKLFHRADGKWQPAGTSVTVHDCLLQSGSLSKGMFVKIELLDGEWFTTQSSCINMQGVW